MQKFNNLIQSKSFQLNSEQQKMIQIETMIKNFKILISQLEEQVKIEEKNSGIFDINSYNYSISAKACIQRVKKLQSSIEDLNFQKETLEPNIKKLTEELLTLQKVAFNPNRTIKKCKKA